MRLQTLHETQPLVANGSQVQRRVARAPLQIVERQVEHILADIGVPPALYARLGLPTAPLFHAGDLLTL